MNTVVPPPDKTSIESDCMQYKHNSSSQVLYLLEDAECLDNLSNFYLKEKFHKEFTKSEATQKN